MKNILKVLLAIPAFVVMFFIFQEKTYAARYQYVPTSGELVTGTDLNANSRTAGAVEGVNTGSWRGTLADDNYHWMASSTASGINMQLRVDGVELNGSNKLLIQTEIDTDANMAMKFQICDWVSSTDVNHSADSQCTGGGWRSLNSKSVTLTDINYTDTAGDAMQWHIYNGYFSTSTVAGGLPINTPLSNFVSGDSNKRVLIRYFSTTNSLTAVAVDFLRITTIIDSIYWPAGFVNLASGTPVGYYANSIGIGNTAAGQQTVTAAAGSDNLYFEIPGTASQRPAFYIQYKDIRTYTGMNAVLVRAEYACSTTGINIAPYIYNFNSSAWEILTSATIACSATDAVGVWAKGNVNINDYISTGASGGDIHIKWEGSANNVLRIKLDYQFVMVGSVNSDSSLCEITMGSGTASNCQNTRSIDTSTSTPQLFANGAEDESGNMGSGEANSIYGFDVDHDTVVEESTSANISFPVTLASNMQVAGVHYSARYAAGTPGATALTVQPGLRDYSGITAALGGWVQVGATSNSATQVYTDSLTTLTVALYGYQNNPHAFIDTTNNRMNMRLRPTASGTSSTNTTTNWDFSMVSLQWIESPNPTKRFQYTPTSGYLAIGTEINVNTATTTGLEGSNMGSWKGTLADDNVHWMASSTASGINMQLRVDGVELNNSNKMVIQTEIDTDLNMTAKFQVCDWISSTDVNHSADSECTGGGWRSLNTKNASYADVNFTASTGVALQWHIYNGYFATSTTAGGVAIDTPLSNFISDDANKRVLIRYFSTTNSLTAVSVDFLRVNLFTDSVYSAGGFTNLGSGNPSGSYINTILVGNSATAQQSVTAGDAISLDVPGTAGSPSDFYLTFKNVKTLSDMNAIYVKADYRCSIASNTHRPKIYNFASSSWEDLTTASIACTTSDVTNAWAKTGVNLNDYLSTGESGGDIRIGWRTLSNGTQAVRLDYVYVMVGIVNTDTGLCTITFGTGTATDCQHTRNLDQNGVTNNYVIFAEDESLTGGTGEANSFYPNDVDHDTTVEEAVGTDLNFSVSLPSNYMPAVVHYALRYSVAINGTNPDMVITPALKDYAGFNATQVGGWVTVGANSTVAASTTSDSITQLAIATYGAINNADDYIDTVNNRMGLRLRTSTSGTASVNNRVTWDFAMISLAWVDSSPPPSSGITVSGIVYDTDESTPLTSETPVKLSVNGLSFYVSTSTAVSGVFSFGSVTQPSNGDILTLWLNTDGGDKGTLVFDYGSGCIGGDCTNLAIYKNRVMLESKNNSVLSNTSLAVCDNITGVVCTDNDIGFVATTSALTLTWPMNVLRLATTTANFVPGGNINAVNFIQSEGFFDGGTGLLTFDGDFILSGGIATSTSGSLRIARNIIRSGSGKFNHNYGEVVALSPWLDSTISGMGSTSTGAFYKLRVDIPDKTVKITAGENLYVEDRFIINGQPGAINKIMSTVAGEKWFLNIASSSLFNWTGIADAGCIPGTKKPFTTPEVRNFGNNGPCWEFIILGGGGATVNTAPPDDPSAGGGGGGVGIGGGGVGGGGCQPARAQAVLQSGAIDSINLIFGGSCYADPPQVVFIGGGGAGAEAVATVLNGHVQSVTVTNAGSGYVIPPTINFVGESGSGGGEVQTGGGAGSGGGGGEVP